MSQRISVLQELGERFEQAIDADPPGERERERQATRERPTRLRLSFGGLVAALAVVVAVIVGVGAIALLRHASPRPGGAAARNTLQALESEYGVLRRPQSAADRSDGGSGRVRLGTTFGGTRLIGLPRFVDLPSLTRVVNHHGVRVVFFVEQLIARRRPLRQIGARRLTHQELAALLRSYNSLAGYSLWVNVAGNSPVPILIAPRPAGRTAAQRERTGFHDSTLLGPGRSFVGIVPDRVAQVSWSWPREFNTPTLSYLPPVTITATATENVAVDRSGRYLSPQTATWVAASGAVIAHYASPNSATEIETATPPPRRKPAPQTALSRRAERNPSTPNRVVVVPSNGTTSTAFSVLFRALLNGHAYSRSSRGATYASERNPVRSRCASVLASIASVFTRADAIARVRSGCARCRS